MDKGTSAESTLQALEELLAAEGFAVDSPGLIKSRRDRGIFSLSFAQERLWFLDRLGLVGPAYNVSSPRYLDGVLDVAALEKSLTALLQRHEVLRSRIETIDGEPTQFIEPCENFKFAVRDFSKYEEVERAEKLREAAQEDRTRLFDLAKGPLFRACLIKLAEQEHVLLLTLHHIVSDGWSTAILNRELNVLYDAFKSGRPSPLPELAIQYSDYAVWQREWLQGEVLDRQLAYWRQRLEGAPQSLDLPTDRPRPAVATHAGSTLAFSVSSELTGRLEALARREGVTLFMVVLAAYQSLLSRWSHQKDIVVGVPIAGRTHRQTEDLIGFFVNTLVLRSDFSDDPSFRILLQRVKETTLGAYAHQDVPFEKLVAELAPERDLSRQPLFQAALSFQNLPRESLELEGIQVRFIGVKHTTSQFDLSFILGVSNSILQGFIEYSTDLFDRSTVERLALHFTTLLEAIAVKPDLRISEISLLTQQERNQLLVEWNATGAPYPSELCIHQLFEEQVAKVPEALAVVCEGRSLTYAELNRRSNQLAHHLITLGVKPDSRVAICVKRSLDMVIGLLAILKAGGAYVPLDPAYPAERLNYMLKDSVPSLVLTNRQAKASLEQAATQNENPASGTHKTALLALDLQEDKSKWASHPATNPQPQTIGLTSRNLAYIIYTSGSTGQPKGVMIEHSSAVNFIDWACKAFSAEELGQTLFSTSLNFDLSIYECFVPLAKGTTTHVVNDVLDLCETSAKVTLINTVPSAAKALLEHEALPSTAHTINLAGEPLKADLTNDLLKHSWIKAVCNLYGPSETTTYSIWTRMDQKSGFVNAIGRPLSNTQIYLLDNWGNPVPIGVIGEIYIGGAGVARGYWNRSALTAERFIANPFVAGDRLYKTGDLGRYLQDGSIQFLGRNDFQVKIRGYRIELGEVEARLASYPGIREVVVVVTEKENEGKRLVAYYVPVSPAVEIAIEAIRNHAGLTLPEYMVPAAWVRLESLPLTANGKLDRKALRVPEAEEYARREYEKPVGPIEIALAEIWSELLGIDMISRRDNFFELGGHSLLAMRMIARVGSHPLLATEALGKYEKRTGTELSYVDIFSVPTIASICELFSSQKTGVGSD